MFIDFEKEYLIKIEKKILFFWLWEREIEDKGRKIKKIEKIPMKKRMMLNLIFLKLVILELDLRYTKMGVSLFLNLFILYVPKTMWNY